MTPSDVKKLWALLAELYPRQPQAATAERLGAWAQALEPYDYEAVKQAALAHARKSDYYPSISEITANLPQEDRNAWMDECIERQRSAGELWQEAIDAGQCVDAADDLGAVSRYAREHGLTWQEAKEALGGAK